MSERVTLRVNDAMIAMQTLRASIERMDAANDAELAPYRAEQWEAYERIANALRLKPTISRQTAKPQAVD